MNANGQARAHWRLCQSRSEIGFDSQEPWGSWDGLVRAWWFESQAQAGDSPKFHAERAIGSSIDRFDLDSKHMDAERRRIGLTTPEEREVNMDRTLQRRLAQLRPSLSSPRAP